ncbi:MAG: zinc-dependent metalloprotease, partial [Verrucomicrobiaceae bacterium]
EDDSRGGRDMADPRFVTIRVQHSLVAMPENDYQPRFDDPRVGYFMTQLTDQTSTEATPYRDFIHRWNLKKKDPAAAVSEPVEPIVWWIENTTPREFRETIRNSALLWNRSFEKTGFKNALVVNEQPDDAKWKADDIEHNVLRWTSSPKAPFGGYGPHFVNPRTGQILGADVMLEFSFVKNRVMARRLWEELGVAGLSNSVSNDAFDPHACMAATMTQQGLLFGSNMLRLRKADQVEFDVMLKEAMAQLVLHELGHTLGLNHNFRASHLHTPAELQDRALTERTGLSASVMDYMPLNLGPDKQHQGQYFLAAPGPYDDWAIEYGYSVALPDLADEAKRLAAIAGRSHEPQLAFANDADDMRKAGKAIDPRAQVFDMSSDPIAYGVERCEIVQQSMGKLLADHPKEGRSWQELVQGYISLSTEMGNALTAISRFIGGVYVERAFVGQVRENAPDPFKPVEVEKQKAAMAALAKFAFGPASWQVSDDLLRHLQQQRRGFDFRDSGEDPKLHERVLAFQRALLEHLLHANTQNRILDSALYGNGYPLQQMMRELTQAIMDGEAAAAPVTTMRQNLQLDYVDRLIGVVKGRSHLAAGRSVALYELRGIEKKLVAEDGKVIEANRPHHAHLLFVIKQGLDEKKA